MIVQFKIKNFRSILDLTLDFRYTEGKAPNGYKNWETLPFLDDESNNRIIPCLAMFGANASGKTNIIKAMHVFRRAVTEKDSPVMPYFEPNKLHQGLDATTFELTTLLGGDTFVYRLEYNGTEICGESLTKKGEPLYQVNRLKGDFTFSTPATGYSCERLQTILNVECSDGKGHQTVCFLKKVAQNYSGLNADLKRMFDAINTGILVLINNNLPLPVALDTLSPFHGGDRKAALEEIVSIVRMLDIDILSIAISHRLVTKTEAGIPISKGCLYSMLPDGKQVEIVDIQTIHNNMRGEPVEFNFIDEESEGTQRVASLVGLMLACLKGGRTLFVDELENSLHPLLLKELIRLFKDKRYNRSGAQIVFATHNTDILDNAILRLGEVAIVRKAPQAGTLVRRLVDFKEEGLDVRNVTNFRKQYLDGFYSGIPHPAI